MDLEIEDANRERIDAILDDGEGTITGQLQVEAVMTYRDKVVVSLNVATKDGEVLARFKEFTIPEGSSLTINGAEVDFNVLLHEA